MTITYHHDGHGLNEDLIILTDERDPNAGGASHYYWVYHGDDLVADVQFQHGPRHVEGSTPGVTDGVLLAIVLDRMECFQKGPFKCSANTGVANYVRDALAVLKARANERAKRGVLGKNEV